jgi:hypothetical protein
MQFSEHLHGRLEQGASNAKFAGTQEMQLKEGSSTREEITTR